MKPRLVQVMLCVSIAGAALAACRKEVPTPVPDRDPKPTVTVQTQFAFGRTLHFGA